MAIDKKILLLGFGNMGQALAKGWLAHGIPAGSIAVVDPQSNAQTAARAQGLRVLADGHAEEGMHADIVVFAVKPAQLADSVEVIENASSAHPVYLSIVAGKTTAQLSKMLGADAAVVRAMPNTPAAIGAGATGIFANKNVSAEQRRVCEDLLAAVGTVEWVGDEALMDVVTALSGSGPAYVFLLIECLTEVGIELGLSADVAARLATATVAGAGAYAARSDHAAAELRRRVTSPQGTTQAALDVLQSDDGLAELMRRAVQAAAKRSRELAGE